MLQNTLYFILRVIFFLIFIYIIREVNVESLSEKKKYNLIVKQTAQILYPKRLELKICEITSHSRGNDFTLSTLIIGQDPFDSCQLIKNKFIWKINVYLNIVLNHESEIDYVGKSVLIDKNDILIKKPESLFFEIYSPERELKGSFHYLKYYSCLEKEDSIIKSIYLEIKEFFTF